MDWHDTQHQLMHVGSLLVDVTAPPAFFEHIILRFFRFPFGRSSTISPDCQLTVTFEKYEPETDNHRFFNTGLVAIYMYDAEARSVFAATTSETDDVESHLHIAVSKWLFMMRRVHLHAAAVHYHDQTAVFFGAKGAGKSTLSLRLARAGGTILAEDHIIVRAATTDFRASGCDDNMRLTEKTERYFFSEGLHVPSADFAGVPKKEIRLADYSRAEPYTDYPIHSIFFPTIAGSFSVEPIKPTTALQRLVESIRPYHRFEDAQDQFRFIDFFANLVEAVSLFDLTLSSDLNELDKLIEFLE